MIKLTIHPDQAIQTIQLQFRMAFPFLNIECFHQPHAKGQGSVKTMMIPPATLLSGCMKTKEPVTITFNPTDTVRQFEEHFKKVSGLNVQVFRKSGNLWLETTATDDWTLQQENDEGKKSGIEIKVEIENTDDHDVY